MLREFLLASSLSEKPYARNNNLYFSADFRFTSEKLSIKALIEGMRLTVLEKFIGSVMKEINQLILEEGGFENQGKLRLIATLASFALPGFNLIVQL